MILRRMRILMMRKMKMKIRMKMILDDIGIK